MAGTRWVRLDVDYFVNAKSMAAGLHGRAAHLASICWAGSQLTDGHIPASAVPTILHVAGANRRAVELVVDAGLWLPNGDGFDVHDFVVMNGTRAQVEHEREQWRERQRRARAKSSPENHP